MEERRRKVGSSTEEISLSSKGVVDRKGKLLNWKLEEITTLRIVEGIWRRREVWRRREMAIWWNLREVGLGIHLGRFWWFQINICVRENRPVTSWFSLDFRGR